MIFYRGPGLCAVGGGPALVPAENLTKNGRRQLLDGRLARNASVVLQSGAWGNWQPSAPGGLQKDLELCRIQRTVWKECAVLPD